MQGWPSKVSGVEGGSAWIPLAFEVVSRTSMSFGRLVRWWYRNCEAKIHVRQSGPFEDRSIGDR